MFGFVLAAIYWLHRSKERFGGGQDVARGTRSAACRSICTTPVRFCGPAAKPPTSALSTARDRYSGPDPARGLAAARLEDTTMPESVTTTGRPAAGDKTPTISG